MIIDLPKTFRFTGESSSDYAEIKEGVLHLYGNVSFRKIMYNITYCLKGNKVCYYCGKKIGKKRITLDHIYPQDMGGPTIPNNLMPCCKQCNCDKANLSYEQYKTLLQLRKKEKQTYRKAIRIQQELFKQRGQSELPKEWISISNTETFITRVEIGSKYKGEKYNKIKSYYRQYHTIQKPIVVDKNGFVLDGYITLMFAKEKGIKKVPVIVLENVIMHL